MNTGIKFRIASEEEGLTKRSASPSTFISPAESIPY